MSSASNNISRRSRTSRKGSERRKKLMDMALHMFGKAGYHHAPIAGIAREAGLSLPGLLHHFPSKEALLLAVLEKWAADLETTANKLGDDWRDVLQLGCIITEHHSGFPENARAFSLLNTESLIQSHPASAWFVKRQTLLVKIFSRALAGGIERGEIRADIDPGLLSVQIVSMLDGLLIQWLRNPQNIDLARCFENFIDLISEAISTPRLA